MGVKFKGIKTAAEYRRGELTKDILRLVAAGVIVGSVGIVAPNAIQLIEYFQPRSRAERNKIWKAIKYLEAREKLLLTEDSKRGISATLTEKGRAQLNEDSIWDLRIDPPRRWDRKWRLIMFDLPVRHERARHPFRRKLEDFGLKLYQRSVFIYPHECYKEVRTVAEWYGVHRYVRYIVATEINDMRVFVRKFDLL